MQHKTWKGWCSVKNNNGNMSNYFTFQTVFYVKFYFRNFLEICFKFFWTPFYEILHIKKIGAPIQSKTQNTSP